jgi:ribonucleoside-diphosphate reductase alpha chain
MSNQKQQDRGLQFDAPGVGLSAHYGTYPVRQASAKIKDETGAILFTQDDLTFPEWFSDTAVTIVASKYFYGPPGKRERSFHDLVTRVISSIMGWGLKQDYFDSGNSGFAFADRLVGHMVRQHASFNSPVWFNAGLNTLGAVGNSDSWRWDEETGQAVRLKKGEAYVYSQLSACFILGVDDTMEAISRRAVNEMTIFKYGSGAGSDNSRLRSRRERLSGGGRPSGPCSFMKIYDAVAGVTKCLKGDSLLATSAGMIPIDRIGSGLPNGFTDVDGLTVAGRLGPIRADRVYVNGSTPTTTVHLERTGIELTGTHDHPVLVMTDDFRTEWRNLVDLVAGDRVAVGRGSELWASETPLLSPFGGTGAKVASKVHGGYGLPGQMTEELAYLLGYLASEGSVDRTRIRFCNADKEVFDHFVACFKATFDTSYPRGVSERTHLKTGVVTYEFSVEWKSAALFLVRLGADGRSGDKTIPSVILESPWPIIRAFLRAYFDGDGHVSRTGMIFVSSKSRRMLHQVQCVLLNAGMVSNCRRESVNGQVYYRLQLFSTDAAAFAGKVGFISVRKQTVARELASRNRKRNRNYDTIPYLTKVLKTLRTSGRVSTRKRYAGEADAVAVSSFTGRRGDITYDAARRQSVQIQSFMSSEGDTESVLTLRHVLAANYFWDRVASVEPGPDCHTFDLHVPGDHAFIANGVVCHNSGGVTRRAAKMEILRCDHPDIEDFINLKRVEEDKARALIKQGYAANFNGEAYSSVLFQNSNLTVRYTDKFMELLDPACENDTWQTIAVTTGTHENTHGEPMPTHSAKELFRLAAEGAWRCGDPGAQYDDTIQKWHTTPNSGRIWSTNPCLRRGGRLLTRGGWRAVETLVGDDVEIFDGVGFVRGSVWHTGRKSLVRLTLATGEQVDVTPDHQIYTDAGWVEAGKCLGRKVPRVVPPRGCGESSQLLKAITGGSGKFYNSVSEDLAVALGFLQGDGGIRDDIDVVSLYLTPGKDDELVERIVPILDDIAAERGEDYQASPLSGGRSGFTWCRKKLKNWLLSLGFTTDPLPTRRLPSLVWSLKDGALRAFLSGLFAANGNVLKDARDAVVLVSTCREMLLDVQLLLRQLGILSAVRRHNKEQEIEWANGTYVSKESWHLEITTRRDVIVFARLIGFPQPSQAARLDAVVNTERESSTYGRSSAGEIVDVVGVISLNEEDDVYDFQSPTTAMGVCNGVLLHNCSEYVYMDNTSCNLASINLLKFRRGPGDFDVEGFRDICRTLIVAQDILVDSASYPTDQIAVNSHRFRPLGLGYANLGALIMVEGYSYDSDEGRTLCGLVTALMHGSAYLASAELAEHLGPFGGYAENREPMLNVIKMHGDAANELCDRTFDRYKTKFAVLISAVSAVWKEVIAKGTEHGFRNSQVTVLAPTGCATPETLVLTDRGLRRLGRLGDTKGEKWQDVDFKVQTNEGPKQADKFFINGVDSVINAETAHGYRFRATPKHRIRVVGRDGRWVWKRMRDLDAHDVVPLQIGGMIGDPVLVALLPLESLDPRATPMTVPTVMTRDLAELIGGFMANGSTHEKGLRISVFRHDTVLVARTVELFAAVFGLHAEVNPGSHTDDAVSVDVNSVPLRRWWEASGFAKHPPTEGHSGKGYLAHVPDQILETNDPLIYAAFLRGEVDHDGTVAEGCPEMMSANRQYIADLKVLALALGFPTTLRKTISGKSGKPLWRARLVNREYGPRWSELIGFTEPRKRDAVAATASQSGRNDIVIVPKDVLDRVCPIRRGDRRAALIATNRTRGITRTMAQRLYLETRDEELRYYLGFFYDTIESTTLEDSPTETYDLSVPENVTWTGGAFVSHNTIGFMMDCSTFGIEPELALVKYKNLAGGGMLKIVNQTIPEALKTLGYGTVSERTLNGDTARYDQIAEIVDYINQHGTVEGCEDLKPEHLAVFDCSFPAKPGGRSLHWMAHLKMMAAAQPFLSGAQSKTVNMPADSTVEDIEQAYYLGWKLGLKAVALYRDGCKDSQPLSTTADAGSLKDGSSDEVASLKAELQRLAEECGQFCPVRRKLPDKRRATTYKFKVGGHKGYLNVGFHDDGGVGEIFVTMDKEGTTLAGIMDGVATLVSMGLQYGVPLRAYCEKFAFTEFEPKGMTNDPDLPFAKSLLDYLFRKLGCEFVPGFREEYSPTYQANTEPATPLAQSLEVKAIESAVEIDSARPAYAGPPCEKCNGLTVRTGPCFTCMTCGTASGGCS